MTYFPGKRGEQSVKVFNTTANCIPEENYMVDISERLKEIKKMVDEKKYFTINRARQYGKTTTLKELANDLRDEYCVLSLDFQKISNASYRTEEAFIKAFSRIVLQKREQTDMPSGIAAQLKDYVHRKEDEALLDELFSTLTEWCEISAKPIVLLIDEVDTASNNQVFLDFLAQLRSGYLKRKTIPAFQSVILAGVTDVKHLKVKIRPDEMHKENSPWNIAADFTIDMSLSETGIKGMLDEYDADHQIGMDTGAIAILITEYTNGYPFLVSRICQLIDKDIAETISQKDAWTRQGVEEAVKLILAENNTLFQSLTKNLDSFPEMKASIRSILMEGTRLAWNAQQDAIVQMQMYGLIRNDHNTVRIANRIFETMLYNLFLSDEELKNNVFSKAGELAGNQFVTDGKLNMRLILQRFCETYTEICGPLVDRFKEKDGREQFLLYLKPIINGIGNRETSNK